MIRSGSSYIDPINFVSASQVGSFFATERRFSGEATAAQFIPQAYRVNTNITEPVSASSNVLGYPASVPLADSTEANTQYMNTSLIQAVADPEVSAAPAFNNLMIKRGNQYGYPSWKQVRQQDNPILTNEHKTNKLSTMYLGNVQRNFDLPPVSMKGRPAYVNLDFVNSLSTSAGGRKEQFQNVTLKTSYNNEMIGFNEWQLDNFTKLNYDSEVTPFEQLVAMKDRNNIQLNWLLYSENVFPSTRREFLSSSVTRVGYDNQFWRDTLANRVTGGMGVPNSVGVVSYIDCPGAQWFF